MSVLSLLGTFLVCGVNMAPQPLLYPKNLIDLVLSVLYPDLGFTPRLGLTSNKGVLRLPGSVSTVLCVLANERERERKYGRSLPGSVTGLVLSSVFEFRFRTFVS